METKVNILLEERAVKYKELDGLVDKCESEKRTMTSEEEASYEKTKREVEDLSKRIDLLREKETRKASGTFRISPLPPEQKEESSFSLMKVVRASARGANLDGFELEMAQEAEKEMRMAGLATSSQYLVPNKYLVQRRAVTATGAGGAEGGFAIPTILDEYVPALREASRVMGLGAKFLSGAVGNIDKVRENSVFTPSFTATENANAVAGNASYTKLTFTPKRLAGFLDVSKQELAQVDPSFNTNLSNQILTGIGEAIDKSVINGAGTGGDLEGILQTSGVTIVVGGTNGALPTRDTLVKLWENVGNSNGLRGSLAFLSNPKVFSTLARTKTDTGSGQFVLNTDGQFFGRPFGVSNNVPSNLTKGTAVGIASAIIFGNFEDLTIMQWGATEVLPDPYTQAVAGFTRMHINVYVDAHVIRPGSFSVMKDALTN